MTKLKPIKIGNKFVGNGHKTYIVAEIGSNFDGKLRQAKKLIQLAKKCGADAVKFQSFSAENLISKSGFQQKSGYQKKWKKSVWETYKDVELPRKWHKELNNYAKNIGIHFFTSVWDFDAVDLLGSIGTPAFKIGSGDLTFIELLKYVGRKKKPILLATGMSTINEIKTAVNTIRAVGNNQIILLQSVIQYPSPINEANLRVLKTLKEKFKLNVGYSDHSIGSLIALASVSLGACIIEKHFTINPELIGPDHSHAMDPKSFKQMIDDVRILEAAMGDGIKKPQPCEKASRKIMRRGIWTIKKVSKGEKFTKENIKVLRPVLGIEASNYRKVLNKKAKRNYGLYEPIL